MTYEAMKLCGLLFYQPTSMATNKITIKQVRLYYLSTSCSKNGQQTKLCTIIVNVKMSPQMSNIPHGKTTMHLLTYPKAL